ncbi:MAG: hypothetical protein APF80_06645 [Alphaproteobacteria bacterium BRH_c36]|nr:MAG: hypothetical protein APF80_06645 [Alphaproteobacteria bacterium BRH_c36]
MSGSDSELVLSVVDNIAQPVVVVGQDDRIEFANKAFLFRFGVTRESALSRSIFAIGECDLPEMHRLIGVAFSEDAEPAEGHRIELASVGANRLLLTVTARRLAAGKSGPRVLLAFDDTNIQPAATASPRDDSQLILTLVDQLRNASDADCVMTIAGELLGRHLDATTVAFAEIDDSEEYATVVADWKASSEDSHPTRYRLCDLSPSLPRDLSEGRTVALDNVCLHPRMTEAHCKEGSAQDVGCAALVVPVLKEKRLVGALAVSAAQAREWSSAQVATVEEFAAHTWVFAERARTHRALHESEQRLRLAQIAGGVGIWEWRRDTGEVYWSEQSRLMFQFDEDVAPAYETWISAVHPEDRAQLEAGIAAAWDHGRYSADYRIIRSDGATRWIRSMGVTDEAVSHSIMRGIDLDVTERKETAEQIRRSKVRYEKLFNSIDEGFCIIEMIFDRDGRPVDYRFTEVNAAFERQTGLENPVGRTIGELVPDLEKYWFEIYGHIAKTGESKRFERWAKQLERYYDVFAFPFGDLDEGQVGILFRDVSERKKQQQKINELFGEVNHRTKNLLSIVQSISTETAREIEPVEFSERLSERLSGLAASQDLIIRGNWSAILMSELIESQVRILIGNRHDQITMCGERIIIKPAAAQTIGMAIHELASNASKYGAWSTDEGTVKIEWCERGSRVVLSWNEKGGPAVYPSSAQGFGRRVIEDMTAYALGADVELVYEREGVSWRLDAPIANLISEEPGGRT